MQRVNNARGKVNSLTTTAPCTTHWAQTWKVGIDVIQDYREPTPDSKAAAKAPAIVNYPSEDFVHMTAAEWSATHKDYKSVQLQPASATYGAHRFRRVMRNGALNNVFVTDKRRIDLPAALGDTAQVV